MDSSNFVSSDAGQKKFALAIGVKLVTFWGCCIRLCRATRAIRPQFLRRLEGLVGRPEVPTKLGTYGFNCPRVDASSGCLMSGQSSTSSAPAIRSRVSSRRLVLRFSGWVTSSLAAGGAKRCWGWSLEYTPMRWSVVVSSRGNSSARCGIFPTG